MTWPVGDNLVKRFAGTALVGPKRVAGYQCVIVDDKSQDVVTGCTHVTHQGPERCADGAQVVQIGTGVYALDASGRADVDAFHDPTVRSLRVTV